MIATSEDFRMFEYDGHPTPAPGNGNLTNDGTLLYKFDVLNRLIAVYRLSDGLQIAGYVYDAGNRRVRKTVTNGGVTGNIPNGTTDCLWLGWQTMEERNPFGGSGSTDTPTKQYIWGVYPDASGLPRESGIEFQFAYNGPRVSIDECVQLNLLAVAGPQSLPIGAYYLLQDLLYRALALTSSGGNVVEAYDEDPYGNTLIFTGPGPDGIWFTDDDVQSNYGANEIIYCGYRFDPETQLYYVRNRTYNPVLGRWIQRDPIGFRGGVHLYQYIESKAPRATDPQGLRHISFVFDSFINGQLRGSWLPQPSIGPIEAGWQFEANTRGFGQFNPGNSKLFSEGWIESMSIGHAKGKLAAYWGTSDVGVSTRRRRANVGYSYQEEKARVFGGRPRVTDGFIGGTVRCDTAIRFTASAGYPFIPLSPPITYDIVFDFAVIAPNEVAVIINGFSTQFPDFEAYVDGGLVYQRELPYSGPGFNDLGPNNTTNYVNVTKTVSAPTACQCGK